MSVPDSLIRCSGCHALVPNADGKTHYSTAAAPGCWAIYGSVIAKEYADERYFAAHRLTVDTYTVQHPGSSSRQAILSVAVHLISLYRILECNFDVQRAVAAMDAALRHRQQFVWLEPPVSRGRFTICDVVAAKDHGEHEHLVQQWARSVWDTWSSHHATIRRWAAP